MVRMKYRPDEAIMQMAKGIIMTTQGVAGLVIPTPEQKPQSAREELRAHISTIAGAMAGITLICERYPWLLSKEDLQYLEDNWARVDRIQIQKK
jgi:hypothetical protein